MNPIANKNMRAAYNEVTDLFRDCARAENERVYFEALAKLHECKPWTGHKKLREWFTTFWENDPKVIQLCLVSPLQIGVFNKELNYYDCKK